MRHSYKPKHKPPKANKPKQLKKRKPSKRAKAKPKKREQSTKQKQKAHAKGRSATHLKKQQQSTERSAAACDARLHDENSYYNEMALMPLSDYMIAC